MINLTLTHEQAIALAKLINYRSQQLEARAGGEDYAEVVTLLGISTQLLPLYEEEGILQRYLRLRSQTGPETEDGDGVKDTPEYQLILAISHQALIPEVMGILMSMTKKYLVPIGKLVAMLYTDMSKEEKYGAKNTDDHTL